jgi:hypothetical protein
VAVVVLIHCQRVGAAAPCEKGNLKNTTVIVVAAVTVVVAWWWWW